MLGRPIKTLRDRRRLGRDWRSRMCHGGGDLLQPGGSAGWAYDISHANYQCLDERA
jgi:hypothetical protein